MTVISQIEATLFVASKPLTLSTIAKAVGISLAQMEEALLYVAEKYDNDSGIQLIRRDDEVQLGTNPQAAGVIDQFVKDEAAGELTLAQLETLTVVAYRGPITRPELEQIRGVNCALIIRNLLIRGLIGEKEDETHVIPVYSLSFEALRHLGIRTPSELPKYDELHAHEFIERLFQGEESNSDQEEDLP